jgi:hypothetical protein
VVAIALALLALGALPLKTGLAALPWLWPALALAAVLPALWLWAGRSAWPLPVLALLGAVFAALAQLSLTGAFHADYDVRPLAGAIKQAQDAGRVVANGDYYHDQFHFAGRLTQPLPAFEEDDELAAWLTANPQALAVVYLKNDKRLQGLPVVAVHRYLGGVAALLEATAALQLLPPPATGKKTEGNRRKL